MVTTSASSETAAAGPSAYRPLLASRLRRPAVVIILLTIIVVTVLGVHYAHHEMAGQLDRTLDAYIRTYLHRDQTLTRALVSLGDPPYAAILLAAVAYAAAIARRWSGVVLALGGTLTAVVITEVILKPVIGRLRYGHLSFPSGHTTVVTAVAIVTAILLIGAQRPRNVVLRLVASLAAVLVALTVAIALIAQHVHYATDTLAGFCIALATVLALALVLDSLAPPRSQPTPTAARPPTSPNPKQPPK